MPDSFRCNNSSPGQYEMRHTLNHPVDQEALTQPGREPQGKKDPAVRA